MGYRNIKPQIYEINDLANHCGMFFDNGFGGGYACSSKSKNKDEPGMCFSWDCPLAYVAEIEDMKELDQKLYDEFKHEDLDMSCEEFVVKYREKV